VAAGTAVSPSGIAPAIRWPPDADFECIRRGLMVRLRSYGEGEIEDAVAEALVVMSRAIAQGRVRPDGRPSAYLLMIARNRLADLRRSATRDRDRQLRVSGSDERERTLDDEDLTRMLERRATAELVQLALRRVDTTTARVGTVFLDLAAIANARPLTSDVAAAAGVSRKTVFSALARLHTTLLQLVDADQSD
jgi:hypothetical protein